MTFQTDRINTKDRLEPWKDALTCLSAANLIFIHSWAEMFPGTDQQYYSNITPSIVAYVSLVVNIITIAALFYVLRSFKSKSTTICILEYLATATVILVSLDAFRKFAMPTLGINLQYIQFTLGTKLFLGIFLIFFGLITLLIIRFPRHMAIYFRLTLISTSPIPLFFSAKIITAMEFNSKDNNHTSISQDTNERITKLVVLIFDEWDREFTFENRPKHINLPEIDCFSREYTDFTHALPAGGETSRSIPGMLTGIEFDQVQTRPHGDMWLKLRNETQGRLWSSIPDIFSDSGALGWKSHFIQWHQVYGPTYISLRPNLNVSHYVRDPVWVGAHEAYKEWLPALRRPWDNLLNTAGALQRLLSHKNNLYHENIITSMEDELISSLNKRNSDSIWAHLAWPHGPAVINGSTGERLIRRNPSISNLDNMILVDRTIQRVRSTMEANGTWDGAMVILTSDHWQRDSNVPSPPPEKTRRLEGLRIPLLVKCPGQRTPRRIESWTSITSLRGWVRALMEGRNIGPDFLEQQKLAPRNDAYNFLKSSNKAD